MSTVTTSVEASLLFPRTPRRDIADDVTELKTRLGALGCPVRQTRIVPGEHLLLHCDTVQVLLAFCAVPFDIEDFQGAARPDHAMEDDARILERLVAHRSSLTVLVADHPSADMREPLARKQRLCWEVVDIVAGALDADLIFWSESDTIYSAAEFAVATLSETAPRPVPTPRHAPFEDATDDIAVPVSESYLAQALSGFGGTPARPHSLQWERLSHGLPHDVRDDPDEGRGFLTAAQQEKGMTYGLITILAAMNGPVAIGTLFYNIFRGENAHLVAQVIAVTALGIAISWASLHEKAFALF